MRREYRFFVYMMASDSGTLYIGVAGNLLERVEEHKLGLKKDCHLVIPQIRTLAKSRCIKKIGRSDQSMLDLIRQSFEAYFWDN